MTPKHALLALVLCTACAEKDPGPQLVDGFDPRLRGIYFLELHSRNDAACEPSAESVADPEPLFAIDTVDYHGVHLLAALSCPDAATCRSHLEAAQAPEPTDEIPELPVDFFFLFSSSRSDGSASSTSYGAVLQDDGTCAGRVYSDRVTHADGQVRIESRISHIPPFPPDGDGNCTLSAAALETPCDAFELVTGTLSGAL